MSSGDLSIVYFSTAFESALGTAATLNRRFRMKVVAAPSHVDEIDDNANNSILPDVITRTTRQIKVTLSGACTAGLLSLLFKYWHHAVPTNAGTNPYTHTWTNGVPNATASSFTMVVQIAAITSYIDRYDGCILKSLELSAKGSGKVEFKAEIEAIGVVTTVSEPAVSNPSEGYFIGRQTTISVGGTDRSARLRDVSLRLENGISILDRCGSTDGRGTSIDHTDRVSIRASYSLDEGAVDEAGGHDDYAAQTSRQIILVFKGDASRDCTITIPAARLINQYPLEIGPHGVYGVKREVIGLLTGANYLTVVTTDDVASYP